MRYKQHPKQGIKSQAMINFSNNLWEDLESQLLLLKERKEHPVKHAQEAIYIVAASLGVLKSFFTAYKFKSKAEEIQFFKSIKPQWTATLIFYREIYNIESSRPIASSRQIKKYYKKERHKLNTYFKENKEFYTYYRTENTFLDRQYFLRKHKDAKDSLVGREEGESNFSTAQDQKVARIIANDRLLEYIQSKLKKSARIEQKQNQPLINWTGSKVALVELMYALHTEKVLNDGKVSLKEMAKGIEHLFNIEIGQFNRIYLEIRNRKTIEKTSFLNALKNSLAVRMEQAEEK